MPWSNAPSGKRLSRLMRTHEEQSSVAVLATRSPSLTTECRAQNLSSRSLSFSRLHTFHFTGPNENSAASCFLILNLIHTAMATMSAFQRMHGSSTIGGGGQDPRKSHHFDPYEAHAKDSTLSAEEKEARERAKKERQKQADERAASLAGRDPAVRHGEHHRRRERRQSSSSSHHEPESFTLDPEATPIPIPTITSTHITPLSLSRLITQKFKIQIAM